MYICFHTFIYAALDGLVVKFWLFFFFFLNLLLLLLLLFLLFLVKFWHTHTKFNIFWLLIIVDFDGLVVKYGLFFQVIIIIIIIIWGWKYGNVCGWVQVLICLYYVQLYIYIYIYIYSWVQVINSVTLSNVISPNNLL